MTCNWLFHLGQCLVYHFSHQVPGALRLVHWKPLVCRFGNPCGTFRDPFLNGLLWSAAQPSPGEDRQMFGVDIQTCLLAPNRATLNPGDPGQCFSTEGWQVAFEKLHLRRGADLDAAPWGLTVEASLWAAPVGDVEGNPHVSGLCSIALVCGGPWEAGSVRFISWSPLAVSLIVWINVLDQNLSICKGWGCTQTAWGLKIGLIVCPSVPAGLSLGSFPGTRGSHRD